MSDSVLHVDAEHVRQWVADNEAATLPASESVRLTAVLETMPWLGASPDWSAVGAIKVGLDDPDLWEKVTRSRLGQHEHAFVMYSPHEPGLVAPLRAVLKGIDELMWGAPGPRFVCGAVRIGDGWEIRPEAFGAYDGADHLMLRV